MGCRHDRAEGQLKEKIARRPRSAPYTRGRRERRRAAAWKGESQRVKGKWGEGLGCWIRAVDLRAQFGLRCQAPGSGIRAQGLELDPWVLPLKPSRSLSQYFSAPAWPTLLPTSRLDFSLHLLAARQLALGAEWLPDGAALGRPVKAAGGPQAPCPKKPPTRARTAPVNE